MGASRQILVLAAAAALCGCATTAAITGDTAFSGKDLDAAIGLYGPWEDHVVLNGIETYIWRRHYTDAAKKQDYYCELRVQMGFRNLISRSLMQGYPAACDLFSIRYTNAVNRS
jgi:hypothetical protein